MLAESTPSLPLALLAAPGAWARWHAGACDRLRARLTEGCVRLDDDVPPSTLAVSEQSLRTLRALTAPEPVHAMLSTLGEREATDPRARSLAERLLHEALQLDPRAQGRFALNQTLPIRFGPRNMEVDLLARRDRVALEVDGYYHFRAPEDFRRDRAKDLLLQKAGWRVVRVLAQDVVDRLDEVLEFVHGALEASAEEP